MTQEICELFIERLVYGGEGLGRDPQGRTVFVSDVAVGEKVRVEITETHRQFARGRRLEILETVPERRQPPCPYYGQCGGCQLQHLTYSAQLAAKVEFVRDALVRLGHFNWPHPINIISGPEWHYRGRTQFKFEKHPHRQGLQVGFYAAGSHQLCEITQCLLLAPTLNQTLKTLQQAPQKNLNRTVGTLDVATNSDPTLEMDQPMLTVSHPQWDLPTSPITRQINNLWYTYDARCFFQGNIFLLESLIQEALKSPDADSSEIAVDLYAGVGLFTLALAQHFEHVFAAEESGPAAHYALRNIAQNQIHNITFSRQSTEEWLTRHRSLTEKISKIVLDPPRVGLSSKAIERLIQLKPKHITYVSCNPSTLARDLRVLCSTHYQLNHVTALDLFPQTYHVEAVAHLKYQT